MPKKLSLWGYYKISLYDAGLGVADPDKGREAKSGWDGFQKDHYFTLKAAWQALAWLEIVARGKYFKGELETMTGSSREHYLEWYLQATADVTRDLSFGLRGMLVENLTEEEDPLGEKELFWYALPEDREWFWKAQVEYKF